MESAGMKRLGQESARHINYQHPWGALLFEKCSSMALALALEEKKKRKREETKEEESGRIERRR